MENEIELIRRFHGHLGPNVIYGYRMGLIARPDHHKDAVAKVYCGAVPPMSCLIDGIQMTSGCTMGKNNIQVTGEGELKAEFEYRNGNKMVISVKDSVRDRFQDGLNHDNEDERSIMIFEMKDEELFDITKNNVSGERQ